MIDSRNKAGVVPEILIYDDIGPDWAGMFSGETMARGLKECGSAPEITVRINSAGGDVFEGLAIYNILTRHPARITVEVDGLAASAASLICMAGDWIVMAKNSMMMIHNAWCAVAGDKNALMKTAATLDKVDANLCVTYSDRSGLSQRQVKTMMNDETWLTASEAMTKGFADEVGKDLGIKMSVPAGRFRNAPARLAKGGRDYDAARRKCDEVCKRLGIDTTKRAVVDRKISSIRERIK